MSRLASTVDARWDWRVSTYARLASLSLLWVVIVGAPALGPLLVPLLVVRFALSPVQLLLNTRLNRRRPLGPRPKADWALFGLLLVAAMVAAALRESAPDPANPLYLLPLLIPFSVIQLRSAARSYRTHHEAPEPLVLRPRRETRAA